MNQNYLSSAEHRTRVILDAYGCRTEAWPAAERQAILDCLAQSPILQHYRAQLEDLDYRIVAAQSDALALNADCHALQKRILSHLPAQTHSATMRKIPRQRPATFSWLRGPQLALALTCILLLAVILGQHHIATDPRPQATTASASFAAWTWYDITGQDLSPKQTSSTVSMTDLIDMELNQNGG